MTEKNSQGEKGGTGKKTLIILLLIFAIVLIVFAVLVIYCPPLHWWSANTVTPPILEASIAVLTLLIAIIAIYMGLTTWMAKRDWGAFEKKTEEGLKEVRADWEEFEKNQIPIIEKLQREQKEIQWITELKDQVLPTDPYLRKDESREVVESIARHYNKDQDDGAWEMYGVGRFFDKEYKYDKAIKSYKEALEKYPTDGGLKLHICHSLGLDYFQRGLLLEAKGKNADAIKDYEASIEYYRQVIENNPQFVEAYRNKAITLIQLGKIKGHKTKPYNNAIYCYEEAIKYLKKIEDNYDHFYDKARAHALLNQPDKAIKSLTLAFKLALVEPTNLITLLNNLDLYREDFKNVEEDAEFKVLEKRYRDINKGNN